MKKINLIEYGVTDSTNTRAKEAALGFACPLPSLFIANAQSAGRGRMGRSFFSPADTGLYASLLFNAPKDADRIPKLTSLAAVAASEAIEARFGIRTDIKWVNDLYLGNKKVAGILAESFMRGTQRLVIVGIGINISTVSFPCELSNKAGSLDVTQNADADARRALALDFSKRLLSYAELDPISPIMQICRERSCVLGKSICFLQGDREIRGVAKDVTDDGELVLELCDGQRILLSSGEISIFFDKGKDYV